MQHVAFVLTRVCFGDGKRGRTRGALPAEKINPAETSRQERSLEGTLTESEFIPASL